MAGRPIVTLLTDFGLHDPFVGIMKGIILGRCPDAQVVDLCHELPPHDILGAGFLLQTAARYFPPETIYVAVVDPGVGGARRALLAEIDGQRFLAPDNGLLSHVLAAASRCRVRALAAAEHWLHPVSATFHGRDVFAPVAGRLAAGMSPEAFGPEVRDPVRREIPQPCVDDLGRLVGQVVWIDRFGNCITNIAQRDLERWSGSGKSGIRILAKDRPLGWLVACFEAVGRGEGGAVLGSTGHVELFVNQGHCAQVCGLGSGDPIVLMTDR